MYRLSGLLLLVLMISCQNQKKPPNREILDPSNNDVHRRGSKYEGKPGVTDLDTLSIYDEASGERVGGDPGDDLLPNPEDGYTLVFAHDFDDHPIAARGNYDPNSDPGWNTPMFNYVARSNYSMAIIDDGADRVFAHYYDQGKMGDKYSDNNGTYATGTYFAAYINENTSVGYTDVYFSFNMKTSPGFYPGEYANLYQEMKIPGVQSSLGLHPDGASIRLRWDNYHTPGSGYISWLAKTAESYSKDTYGHYSPMVGDVIDTIDTRGTEWHNYCMRVSLNTGTNKDGLLEFFYDGVLIGTCPPHWITTNDLITKILVSTADGGSGPHHLMENDMYIYYDDFVVWKGEEGYPGRGEASLHNRVLRNYPPECKMDK